MKKHYKFITYLLLSMLFFQACNLPAGTPDADKPTDRELTATAQMLLIEQMSQSPVVIVVTATSEDANPIPLQETATNTPDPASANIPPPESGTPTVTVSTATNCRTGPGQAYSSIYGLPVGISAEVVGKNTSTNYWIIKIPNGSGTCWLWGQYATVTGDTSGLQNVSIPPTPTLTITPTFTPTKVVLQPPSAPSNLSQTHICSIGFTWNIYSFDGTITWQDTSNNEDGFRVYSFDDNLTGAADILKGTVAANVTSFNFNTSSFGPSSTIKVEAFNNAGASTRVSLFFTGNNCPPVVSP